MPDFKTTDDEIMYPAEVAELMRVPQETLRAWRHQGRGPKSFKFPGSRRVMYARQDVLAFIEAARADSNSRGGAA